MQEKYVAIDIDGQAPGHIHQIETEKEKKANIEEMQDALKAFDKVVDMLRYGRPSATKEQLIRKRALERRAKRKRGGHK